VSDPGFSPATTAPGASRAWLTLLRDHGTQPLDVVLRYAPSTPRPVTLFPG
jgi:hypothetical protein